MFVNLPAVIVTLRSRFGVQALSGGATLPALISCPAAPRRIPTPQGGPSDIQTRLQQQQAGKGAAGPAGRYTGGDSLDEAQFGRAAQPSAGLLAGARDPQARGREREAEFRPMFGN